MIRGISPSIALPAIETLFVISHPSPSETFRSLDEVALLLEHSDLRPTSEPMNVPWRHQTSEQSGDSLESELSRHS
jgi:hypothetical protein